MKDDLKKLFSESLLYGAGSMSSTLVMFLLTPVLTRFLLVEGYGVLSLLNVGIVFATNIFGLGLSSAVFNELLHAREEEERKNIQGTAWRLLIFSAFIFLVLSHGMYFLFRDYLTSRMDYALFLLVLFTAAGSIFTPVFYSILRAYQNVRAYFVLSLQTALTGFIFTLVLVAGMRGQLHGVFEARVLQSLITVLMGLVLTKGFFASRYNKAAAQKLLAFGIHLVPTGLLAWVLELSDRFLVQYFMNAKAVGIYTLGYQYATFLTYPMIAFQMAWPQQLIEYSKSPDGAQRTGRIFSYYLFAVYALVIAMVALAPEGIRILGGAAFRDSLPVVLPVILGYIFFGIYLWGTAGNYLTKDTRRMPWITFAGALLNAFGNIFFIPRFGYMASAYVTLITFALMAVLMWKTVRAVYPMRLNKRKLFLQSALFAIFFYFSIESQRAALLIKFSVVAAMAASFFACERLTEKKGASS